MVHKITLFIKGMTCPNCEINILNELKSINGVVEVFVSYKKQMACISYDDTKTNFSEIKKRIEGIGYEVHDNEKKLSPSNQISILIIVLGSIVILNYLGFFHTLNIFPKVEQNIELGMLFIIGLLTSIHCIAMCGGVNLAQSVSSSKRGDGIIKPNLLYNLGRIISYTLIGGVVGLLGEVIQFSGKAKGMVAILAGIFMIIMGINMLNIFPSLRWATIPMPKLITKKVIKLKASSKSSFIIGLLNGFMPCGPLQGMQLYALSTKSFILGASSMFLFSLGTVPLMLLFGLFSGKLNKKYTKKIMYLLSLLIVILGFGMLNNGLALSGYSINMPMKNQDEITSTMMGEYQIIETQVEFNRYPAMVVKANVPIKWVIKANSNTLNGCNNEIYLSHLNRSFSLKAGETIINMDGLEEGTYTFSCWMGMIRSYIRVVQ